MSLENPDWIKFLKSSLPEFFPSWSIAFDKDNERKIIKLMVWEKGIYATFMLGGGYLGKGNLIQTKYHAIIHSFIHLLYVG